MSRQIEFFYDVMSPYSHLAFWRLPGIAKRSAAVIIPRPVSLPQLLSLAQNTHPSEVPTKQSYIQQDLEALSRYYGIPLVCPEVWPQSSATAMAALALLVGKEQEQLTERLFDAVWVKERDLSDPEQLSELLGDGLYQQAGAEEAQALLQANTQEAFERGAFGVPSSFAGEALFFGNERLFLLQMHLNA